MQFQSLLTNSKVKEWVLYKLDGGIGHLLVDEEQDTSNSQWRIIEAFAQEFYSGESDNNKNRTIFVVGDEKQSTFSFQGADISAFSYMNKFLNDNAHHGLVQVWPLYSNESDGATDEFWLIYQKIPNIIVRLFWKKIANYVKEQISSGSILPSTNNKISARDFMILFGAEMSLRMEFIKTLKEAKIDITGFDEYH